MQLSPRLHGQLQADEHLRKDAIARRYFYRADGTPHPVGHRLRNPALAAVLRAMARQGSDALLPGPGGGRHGGARPRPSPCAAP